MDELVYGLILKNRKEGILQSNVCKEPGLNSRDASRAAKRLERMGMIKRVRAMDDVRRTYDGPCGRDINEVAVRHVKRKVQEKRLTNVEVVLADASKTGLPDSNFVAFLFGVIHALDLTTTLAEMNRVLKAMGCVSVETHGASERRLLDAVTSDGLFRLAEKSRRICRFGRCARPDE